MGCGHRRTTRIDALPDDSDLIDWYPTVSNIRGDGPTDVTLSGATADLLLVLSNRTEDSTITVDGDHDLLDS